MGRGWILTAVCLTILLEAGWAASGELSGIVPIDRLIRCTGAIQAATWTNGTGLTLYVRQVVLEVIVAERAEVVASVKRQPGPTTVIVLGATGEREILQQTATFAPDYLALRPGDSLELHGRCLPPSEPRADAVGATLRVWYTDGP